MEISCASHFSCSCNQILNTRQLKGERGYSDLSVRGIVPRVEGVAADSSEVVGEHFLFTSCYVRKQTGDRSIIWLWPSRLLSGNPRLPVRSQLPKFLPFPRAGGDQVLKHRICGRCLASKPHSLWVSVQNESRLYCLLKVCVSVRNSTTRIYTSYTHPNTCARTHL